jgi:hypothetical protein
MELIISMDEEIAVLSTGLFRIVRHEIVAVELFSAAIVIYFHIYSGGKFEQKLH